MSIPVFSKLTELHYLCGCPSSKMQLVMNHGLCKVDFLCAYNVNDDMYIAYQKQQKVIKWWLKIANFIHCRICEFVHSKQN